MDIALLHLILSSHNLHALANQLFTCPVKDIAMYNCRLRQTYAILNDLLVHNPQKLTSARLVQVYTLQRQLRQR